MEGLKTIELKFILKLLGCEGYRGKMKDLSPNSGTKAPERDRICKTLATKGLVDYSSEVSRFTISRFGKVLLSLDTTSLPVTPDELKLLRTCKGSMSLGKLSRKIPADSHQQIIRSLAARKLINISSVAIKEAWLTEQGKNFLRDKYNHIDASVTYQTPVDAFNNL
ncbi:MAG: hypothetical protein WA885_01545 [Phormidesmis sp.]